MAITHIPANDWAAVGARLERCEYVSLEKCLSGWFATVGISGGPFGSNGHGLKTHLEALTAALDAAEGAK